MLAVPQQGGLLPRLNGSWPTGGLLAVLCRARVVADVHPEAEGTLWAMRYCMCHLQTGAPACCPRASAVSLLTMPRGLQMNLSGS